MLFGGATAYNSYWDKDKGPIGGLQNPPPMQPWMWMASLLVQMLGLMVALMQGSLFVGIYIVSMLFFWLYSTPIARWKGRPLKSMIAIGISTGFNSVLLGYLAAGNSTIPLFVILAALGASLMLLSLYPISQVYQKDEDLRRGDQTFSVQYGKAGVTRFFTGAYFSGLLLTSFVLGLLHLWLGVIFAVLGLGVGVSVAYNLRDLLANQEDYHIIMRIKYGTSLAFVLFLVVAIVLKHIPIDGISSWADLLLK